MSELTLPVIWALGFAHTAMLWGMAAASLPILIHLLNRRKFREVRWAAMRFLIAAIRKNQRRIRIEQWILLAVRTALILLLVAAMAKPFLESLGALPVLAGQRKHLVLVLDGSMSMGYTPAETTTRFDQAKAVAAQLIKDSRRGDAISVVLMADPPRVVIGDPSPNHAEVSKEIAEIALPHGGTDLTATFAAVDRVLEASSIPQKQVVFLTDLQTASWRQGEASDGLKRAVAKLTARQARSVVIDLGKAGGANTAVTELALNTPVVSQNNPFVLRTVLRNFGAEPVRSARVRMMLDGQFGPEQVVDLPPGEDVPVVFTHAFTTPGDHLIEARLDEDPLPLDNHRWLAVPVRESIRVLLVDGDFRSEPFESETDYLAQALSPPSGSDESPSLVRVETVSESQVSRRDLAPYDVVVLCNVAQFTDAEVSALDAYLKRGGGVAVFGGDQVLADNYNRLLHAEGKGLLPAALGAPVGDAASKSGSVGFDALGFRHPIVAAYAGTTDAVISGLTNSRTWQYHKLTLPKDSKAQVALAFTGGDPAVIEMPRHRGRVFQVATSADAGWTTWPLHPSYPPVMEQIVLQAAAGRLAERNVRVGQPFDQALPPSAVEASIRVERPDGRASNVRARSEGDVSRLLVEDTDLSGTYTVKLGPPLAEDVPFAANIDPVESDPAKLDRNGLAEAVPGWDFGYFTDWQSLTQSAGAVSRRGELHRSLLYAVLALLLIETYLAWKFGHHAGGASG